MSSNIEFRQRMGALAVVAALAFIPFANSRAADDPDWDRWKINDPAQAAEPDHTVMTAVLEAFGELHRGQFTLKYDIMKGRGSDVLESYIEYLEGLPISRLNRDEQLAVWLNLYNAGAIHSIVTYRKLPKRLNILRGVPGEPGKLWSKKIFKVEGYPLSLDDIEVNILARHWSGPDDKAMWMYGLTYGAKGSPPLPMTAFLGKSANAQLAESARLFVGRTANVSVKGTNAEVSRIYGWHRTGLGGGDADIINHIKSIAGTGLAGQLEGATTVTADKFNWRINIFVPGKTGLGAPGQGEEGGSGGGGGP